MIFTDHKVHKPPEILGKDAAGNVLARFPDGVRRLTADQLTEFHRRFEERIALEEQDPYRYGYVIPIWSTADQQFAALREEFPEGVTELLILGGNRASKSRYLARRAVQIMVETPGPASGACNRPKPRASRTNNPTSGIISPRNGSPPRPAKCARAW